MKHKNPTVDKKIRSSLKEIKMKTKETILWLGNMKVYDYGVVVPINNGLALWLKRYYVAKHKLPEKVKDLIHCRIMESGRSSYFQINSYTPPDHVMSPYSLAYFLLNGGISKEKAEAIKFDHGDTLESFKATANGFLGYIIGQIMKPIDVVRISKNNSDMGEYDPHPVCDCC